MGSFGKTMGAVLPVAGMNYEMGKGVYDAASGGGKKGGAPPLSSGGAQSGQPSGTQNFGGGGGGGKKSAPPPPDYYGAAQAGQNASQQAVGQQTQANRPNQQTGFGSQSWTQGPNGEWTQNTSLNPTLSGALGGLQSQAANNAANGPQNIQQARDQAIGANYNQATSRLNPQWAQRDEQTQSQLVNQGLDPSSQAYQNAMQAENQSRNDAYSSAMNNAIGQGNQTEQTQLGALMSPYQQMGALQGFQNGLPGFNAAGQWSPANYLGAAEAAGGYGLQGQQMNNQMQGDVASGMGQLFGTVGPMALKASDERIKSNVKRLPIEAAPGIPLATFKYKHAPGGQHHLGVIAQDVEKVQPHAVVQGSDGIKKVNYAALKRGK